ncbi:leucine rich adaptor protein 1-like [Columba livia]|uniref:Leucine rich adaptor protein 1-like n=1 Tax=Columba livia TaxID=8932 RepID=A0A2I0MG05_COLLI|nr:leucine rich adaptor protein 1-like [Columba livia]PKK28630.1 leucine rich adaptor protein 1-like [Columba livia]
MGHINLAFAYVASPLFENHRKPNKHDEEMGKMFQQHITQVHAERNQVNLRATDVKLMRQLLIINESIESIKWMIEEKAIASRGSSLSGSLCSLLESQETSFHGSCNSLQDCSDGLDGISVGSYLDTLVDDVPGHQTPSDMDQFSDSSIMEDSQPLHKHPKIDSDEYYCFG